MPILDTTYLSNRTNRYQAETFWAQYDLPFEYEIAIKGRETTIMPLDDDNVDVDADRAVSGVGFTPNTALHLVVTEEFSDDDGFLHRDAGEFLCKGGGDMPVTGLVRADTDPEGEQHVYTPPATCHSCIQRLRRWRVREAVLAPTSAEAHVYDEPAAPTPGGRVTAADGGTETHTD